MKMRRFYFTVRIVVFAILVTFLVAGIRHKFGHAKAGISPCVMNLWSLQSAKIMWMDLNNKTSNDIPTWDDLKDLLQIKASSFYHLTNGRPVCPQNGTYSVGRVCDPPTCSIGGEGHSLPK